MSPPSLTALLRLSSQGEPLLCSPSPGVLVDLLAEGERVRPGAPIGGLRILDRRHLLLAPPGADGLAGPSLPGRGERDAGHGTPLFHVLPFLGGVSSASEAGGEGISQALPVRAPLHGIFHPRPQPGSPPFVSPGQMVQEGDTLGLLEVMKTFHPLRYGGGGLPPSARVVAMEALEGAEVHEGQVLYRMEPL